MKHFTVHASTQSVKGSSDSSMRQACKTALDALDRAMHLLEDYLDSSMFDVLDSAHDILEGVVNRPIHSSSTIKAATDDMDDGWEVEDDWEEVNDFLTEALDNAGMFSEPSGYGPTAVDYIYDIETEEELGKLRSTTLENMARKYMGSEDGLVKLENALKQKFHK